MSLTEKEREDVVKFRLEKANNTFAEIPVLIENKFYRTAANRLYYSCFYAAGALLINDGYEIHTHSGIKTLLGLHYVKENRIEKLFGKLYEQFIKTIEHLILKNQIAYEINKKHRAKKH